MNSESTFGRRDVSDNQLMVFHDEQPSKCAVLTKLPQSGWMIEATIGTRFADTKADAIIEAYALIRTWAEPASA